MSPSAGLATDSTAGHLPAYGFVDAALTYGMVYVIVDRLSPTVTTTFVRAVPDVSPEVVGLGLAAFLWLVLIVTVVDQARRQLAAVGIGSHRAVDRERARPAAPGKAAAVGYLVAGVMAGVVAFGTVETAIDTLRSTVVIVGQPASASVDLIGILSVILFFVAYGLLTWSVDRLVVGAIRSRSA
jgi:hypothetical protein